MDDKDLKQLFKPASELHLEKEEKAHLRAILRSFMQLNPLRSEAVLVKHGWSRWFKPMPALSGMLILMLTGGGVAAASEQSVPGDILYPIKIKVNEEVRAALAVTADAKADWEVRRSERRLEEAEQLAAVDKLSSAVKAKLGESFEKHVELAKEQKTLKINERIEKTIQKHQRILAQLTEEDEVVAVAAVKPAVMAVRKIAASKKEAVQEEAKQGISAQADVAVMAIADDAFARTAEQKAQAIAEYLLNVRAIVGMLDTEAMLRLEMASTTLAEGRMRLKAKAYSDAFVLFQKAGRLIQEAKNLQRTEQVKPIEIEAELESFNDELKREQAQLDRFIQEEANMQKSAILKR